MLIVLKNMAKIRSNRRKVKSSSSHWVCRGIDAGGGLYAVGIFFMPVRHQARHLGLAQHVLSRQDHCHPQCIFYVPPQADMGRRCGRALIADAGDRSWKTAPSWDTWAVTALCSLTKQGRVYAPSKSITTIKNEAAPWREAASAVSSTWETLTFTSSPWEAME